MHQDDDGDDDDENAHREINGISTNFPHIFRRHTHTHEYKTKRFSCRDKSIFNIIPQFECIKLDWSSDLINRLVFIFSSSLTLYTQYYIDLKVGTTISIVHSADFYFGVVI